MSKKKRQKLTVFGCVEGDREHYFLNFLIEVYQPNKNNINLNMKHCSGGTPDKLVHTALQRCDRDRSFAWFDEDFEPDCPLGQDIRESLARCWNIPVNKKAAFLTCPLKDLQIKYNQANRKPTLVISHPVCSESFILRVLAKELPYDKYEHAKRGMQIKGLKNKLDTLIAAEKTTEIEFYRKHLSKESLEKIRKEIFELDLLIKMITKLD